MKNNGINNLFEATISNIAYSILIAIILICEIIIHIMRNIEIINADFLPPKKFLSINQAMLVTTTEISAGIKISSNGISLILSANNNSNGNNENKKT
jgi:hypothetical protein